MLILGNYEGVTYIIGENNENNYYGMVIIDTYVRELKSYSIGFGD